MISPSITLDSNDASFTISSGRPDTILEIDGYLYIIDAKYYQFGFGSKKSLPPTSDVMKQVAYQKYWLDKLNYSEDKVVNVFALPSNASIFIDYIGFASYQNSKVFAYSFGIEKMMKSFIGVYSEKKIKSSFILSIKRIIGG